jgi:hypothetical protein
MSVEEVEQLASHGLVRVPAVAHCFGKRPPELEDRLVVGGQLGDRRERAAPAVVTHQASDSRIESSSTGPVSAVQR